MIISIANTIYIPVQSTVIIVSVKSFYFIWISSIRCKGFCISVEIELNCQFFTLLLPSNQTEAINTRKTIRMCQFYAIKWFFNNFKYHLHVAKLVKKCWKHLNGMCYQTRLIYHTLLHQITIFQIDFIALPQLSRNLKIALFLDRINKGEILF